jgi:hypothetical protein
VPELTRQVFGEFIKSVAIVGSVNRTIFIRLLISEPLRNPIKELICFGETAVTILAARNADKEKSV